MRSLARKAVVAWCLYGVVRIFVFVNPWLFRLLTLWKPYYDSNERWKYIDPEPWDSTAVEQIIEVWFCTVVGVGILCGALFLLHKLSDCILTKK